MFSFSLFLFNTFQSRIALYILNTAVWKYAISSWDGMGGKNVRVKTRISINDAQQFSKKQPVRGGAVRSAVGVQFIAGHFRNAEFKRNPLLVP